MGLILGLAFGLRDQIVNRGLDRDESYLILASTLYGQDPTPAVAADLRRRLMSLGFPNPSLTVLKLSDRFAASRDRERQREAEGLRIFGEGIGVGVEVTDAPAVTATPGTAPTAAALTTNALEPLPVATPAAQPSPAATPQPTAAQPLAGAPVAAATPTPQGTPATTKSADKLPIVLRKEPSTQSAKVALIPVGAKVEVLRVVEGKPGDPGIDPKEPRWYQVRFNNVAGYVYFKLITVGE